MQKIATHSHTIQLSAELAPAKEESARTAILTWYTGATVQRRGWDGPYLLTLSMKPEHVRMERLASGKAPLLNSHSDYSLKDVIGIVESADLTGHAKIRFSNRPEVDPIWQDVQDGIIRNASVGAAIHKLQDTSKDGSKTKSFLAVDWEPMEVSLVPIGADPNAGFADDHEDNLQQLRAIAQKGETMSEQLTAGANAGVSQNDADQIRQIGMATDMHKDFVEGAIAAGISVERARKIFIDERARLGNEIEIHTHCGDISLIRDKGDTIRAQMENAMFARMTGTAPSDSGREYMGARLSDMAADLLRSRGLRVTSRNPAEIIRLAITHTTSDFPYLLQGTGQRVLLARYQTAQSAIKRLARQSTVNDFRVKSLLRLGEAPKLIQVPESGEITHGTRAEVKESYRAYTYGRLFSLSREALINDDLSAFADFLSAFGQSAASLEAQILVDLLAQNGGAGPTMEDGKALFHTDHGNLAGSGAAISDMTLAAARLALRTTTGIDGETIIETAPRYLLVPAALETAAEKYLATLYPAQASNVNPFAGGKLELAVEPRLDSGVDAYRWWVFGDPSISPVLEYAYLEGQEGPKVESRAGWEQLGIEFRCYEDFGAGAIGYRGAFCNPGH